MQINMFIKCEKIFHFITEYFGYLYVSWAQVIYCQILFLSPSFIALFLTYAGEKKKAATGKEKKCYWENLHSANIKSKFFLIPHR